MFNRFRIIAILWSNLFLLWPQTNGRCSAATPTPATNAHAVIVSVKTKDNSPSEFGNTDLEIFEDNKPATVIGVRKLGPMPLHYCIVLDISQSQKATFKQQQDATTKLLKGVIRPQIDRGWVVLAGQRVRESTETGDPQEIMDVIAQETPAGSTAIFDAMASCSDRIRKTEPDSSVRAMFVFSDGEDNTSHINREEVADLAINARMRIYAFAAMNMFAPESASKRGLDILTEFTQLTGGRLFSGRLDGKQMHAAIEQISDDLTSLVEVTYSAGSNLNSGVHKLKVKPRKKGLVTLAPELYVSTND